MKKKNRVKDSREFQTIMSNKCYQSCGSMVVYGKPRKDEETRIGISVSKKIGNAVIRNKTKRQVREMVHSLIPLEDELDYIIIIRNGFSSQSFEDNKKDLERCLKKVKIRITHLRHQIKEN